MLNFLKEIGIKENTIKMIEEMYSEAVIFSLNGNEFEVVKIIEYFREIGIEDIDSLFVDYLEVFFCKYSEVVAAFNKYETEILVAAINYDNNLMEKVLFMND